MVSGSLCPRATWLSPVVNWTSSYLFHAETDPDEGLNEDEVEVTFKKLMALYEQAKAGIGIAIAVAVSMLLGLLYLFVHQNKRKQLRHRPENLLPAESNLDRAEIFSTPLFEKDGSRLKTSVRAEMVCAVVSTW